MILIYSYVWADFLPASKVYVEAVLNFLERSGCNPECLTGVDRTIYDLLQAGF